MEPSGAGGKQTILVVEDAEAIRRMICSMLMQCGFTVIEAGDGVEALQLLEQRAEPVHLVVTDVIMPQMHGTELARRLAQLRPGLRVIFMSGFSDDPVVRTVEREKSFFLPKPFTTVALVEKVREALNQPNGRSGGCP